MPYWIVWKNKQYLTDNETMTNDEKEAKRFYDFSEAYEYIKKGYGLMKCEY